MYGLLAETIEWPEDRSWIIFHLNPKARWHDGEPVTADDVIFSFRTLVEKGHPQYRFYYPSVTDVEKLDERSVKFTFEAGENRELPLILDRKSVVEGRSVYVRVDHGGRRIIKKKTKNKKTKK